MGSAALVQDPLPGSAKGFCLILFMPSNVDNGEDSTIKMLRIMVKVMLKFSVLVLMTTTKTVM